MAYGQRPEEPVDAAIILQLAGQAAGQIARQFTLMPPFIFRCLDPVTVWTDQDKALRTHSICRDRTDASMVSPQERHTRVAVSSSVARVCSMYTSILPNWRDRYVTLRSQCTEPQSMIIRWVPDSISATHTSECALGEISSYSGCRIESATHERAAPERGLHFRGARAFKQITDRGHPLRLFALIADICRYTMHSGRAKLERC